MGTNTTPTQPIDFTNQRIINTSSNDMQIEEIDLSW